MLALVGSLRKRPFLFEGSNGSLSIFFFTGARRPSGPSASLQGFARLGNERVLDQIRVAEAWPPSLRGVAGQLRRGYYPACFWLRPRVQGESLAALLGLLLHEEYPVPRSAMLEHLNAWRRHAIPALDAEALYRWTNQ